MTSTNGPTCCQRMQDEFSGMAEGSSPVQDDGLLYATCEGLGVLSDIAFCPWCGTKIVISQEGGKA